MKLYEIAEQYRLIDTALDESAGEITPEIEQALAELDDQLEAKVDGIGSLVREALAEHNAFTLEAARLGAHARTAALRAERLKEFLLRHLTAMGRDKVKGLRFSARVATASTTSITWTGTGDVPAEFARVKVELDGRKAHEAEKAGTLPEGFKAVRTTYLDLR